MNITGISPGKIILSGEHSVVYGFPAIAFPIELTTTVKLIEDGNIRSPIIDSLLNIIQKNVSQLTWYGSVVIESTLPIGSGLGSSAALAHALINALGRAHQVRLTQSEKFTLVQECEKYFHGRPSGIDAATVVYQKPIRLQRIHGNPIISPLSKTVVLPPYQLIDSGRPVESTKAMVEWVATLPNKESILSEIGAVTAEIEKQLPVGQLDLRLISTNERLLEKLGVVGDRAKQIIVSIEKAGGYAKIAGAGGRQAGSGMILVFYPATGESTVVFS